MTNTEAIAVGLVAPLPPQVGGVASFAGWLVENQDAIGCRYVTFPLRRPADAGVGGSLSTRALSRQLPLFARFLRWLPASPRVVHVCVSLTGTGLLRDLLLIALLRARGKRVIAHIHGPALDGRRPLRLKRLGLRSIARLASVGVSVVPMPGWDFVPNPLRIEPKLSFAHPPPPPLRLLAVGAVGVLKGSDTLVDAVAQVRSRGIDATLRFVGAELRAGDEEALRQRLRRAGIDNAVEFKGILPRERLAAEYQRANVFCLPSLREGFPMSLIEAMAFSLPVVATPVGAVPEIVRNDVTGLLVESGSRDAIAAALERLVDPELRTRLGEAGARHVRLQCDPTSIRRVWRDLYAELALIDP